ncbi:MAG TPA: uracil-DNA glycosylase [Candidatus Sphingobacterium stercoripullorum]|nr:uracil-DNA glycosylase [Candidatus Sphingobacterium stercoripullorum]
MTKLYHNSWEGLFHQEFSKDYMKMLSAYIQSERNAYKIYPPREKVFHAFQLTPMESLKIVLLGQDPYHGPNQAHGLSFSVPKGIPTPPSLKNIFKELQADIPGFTIPTHGELSSWAQQGVLLLNTVLTVRENQANSHKNAGWEQFTNTIIKSLSENKSGLVFILWGANAKSKAQLIDPAKHLVLEGVHPSPLSAYRGFFGCRHFSKANEYLLKLGKEPIDWNID